MLAFVFRRITSIAVTILVVSFVVYLMMNVVGDPASLLLPPDATQADIEALRQTLGLGRPVLVRYAEFLQGLFRGDFGTSFRYNEPALPIVLERLPVTLKLTGASLAVALLLSVPAGVIAAVRPRSVFDLIVSTLSVAGKAMPSFWIGIMLILLVAVQWKLLPATGASSWRHFVLPAVTLGTGMAASLARLIRSSLLEALRQDYVVTARSKGMREIKVVIKHGLRNALIPVVTLLGLQIPALIDSSIITEQVFAIPGVGQVTVKALGALDFAIVQASVLLGAAISMASTLAVDLIYTILDPRIRYQ